MRITFLYSFNKVYFRKVQDEQIYNVIVRLVSKYANIFLSKLVAKKPNSGIKETFLLDTNTGE